MSQQRCALIMAGGTGGHIFPGLALAQVLHERGWRVHWMGVPGSMESRLVPPKGFAFEPVEFSGVRGKGLQSLVLLPVRLLRALWQSLQVMRRVRPDVVVGFGGYVTVPGGLMAMALRKPVVLHEQNSVAGSANRLLAKGAAPAVACGAGRTPPQGARPASRGLAGAPLGWVAARRPCRASCQKRRPPPCAAG